MTKLKSRLFTAQKQYLYDSKTVELGTEKSMYNSQPLSERVVTAISCVCMLCIALVLADKTSDTIVQSYEKLMCNLVMEWVLTVSS